jgi:hypothetical protein
VCSTGGNSGSYAHLIDEDKLAIPSEKISALFSLFKTSGYLRDAARFEGFLEDSKFTAFMDRLERRALQYSPKKPPSKNVKDPALERYSNNRLLSS